MALSIANRIKRYLDLKTAQKNISVESGLVAILRNHGVIVHMLKTDRVGYVVYEDEYQIVAESFRGDC
jgi:hypothetical protein